MSSENDFRKTEVPSFVVCVLIQMSLLLQGRALCCASRKRRVLVSFVRDRGLLSENAEYGDGYI